MPCHWGHGKRRPVVGTPAPGGRMKVDGSRPGNRKAATGGHRSQSHRHDVSFRGRKASGPVRSRWAAPDYSHGGRAGSQSRRPGGENQAHSRFCHSSGAVGKHGGAPGLCETGRCPFLGVQPLNRSSLCQTTFARGWLARDAPRPGPNTETKAAPRKAGPRTEQKVRAGGSPLGRRGPAVHRGGLQKSGVAKAKDDAVGVRIHTRFPADRKSRCGGGRNVRRRSGSLILTLFAAGCSRSVSFIRQGGTSRPPCSSSGLAGFAGFVFFVGDQVGFRGGAGTSGCTTRRGGRWRWAAGRGAAGTRFVRASSSQFVPQRPEGKYGPPQAKGPSSVFSFTPPTRDRQG